MSGCIFFFFFGKKPNKKLQQQQQHRKNITIKSTAYKGVRKEQDVTGTKSGMEDMGWDIVWMVEVEVEAPQQSIGDKRKFSLSQHDNDPRVPATAGAPRLKGYMQKNLPRRLDVITVERRVTAVSPVEELHHKEGSQA